ncbi:pentatricopeptide repeat-containing protein at1g19720 [Phtheirospermum japonicum]|uniref:Pentatricopeptide repeat-containing protein at1g19720 n=1 Tax=Phtheirospermum japonicum TaxID=374723 RepID=A0A830CAK9_9LAMI|nr:pentatricopeptide repeat-containing protein at1g19720 [Phtheirospermum japonicum]
MDTTILPCKTIIPSKISENPAKKPTTFFRNTPRKLADDAHLKRLCKLGRLSEAISSLDSFGSTVRRSTLSHLIESCIGSNSLGLCHELHARIKNLIKQPDPFLRTKLLGMFAKCGSLTDAFDVFDEMPERNLYTWSAMIGACSRERMWGDVVELFRWMMEDGDVVPDNFLLPKILQACGNNGDLETGRLIHGLAIKRGMSDELHVHNSIIAVYAKCGWLSSAKRFFEGMAVKDRVSWNAIITGFCQAGKINEARELFESMQNEGHEPDVVTWNLLIKSCNQFGKCDVAMALMNEMESFNIKPDVYTWTSMISGFARNNRKSEALKMFRDMIVAGVKPNGVTIMSGLSACSLSMKDIRKGKEIHLAAIKLGYDADLLVGNSLIDMYSKSGKLESARKVFDQMPARDMYTWNSMIDGYCQAGYCGIAHDLFNQMRKTGVLPNVVTWNVMITGYIQKGDEDQAMDIFHEMEKSGAVKRDTTSWNALIAGYLNLGEKDKSLRIFRKMQSFNVKPNYVTILSILPACANLIALKKLKEIHCCVIRGNLESEVSVANSLIDTYAKSGNIKYSESIFYQMPSIDIITWNTMITGYVLHGYANEAIELFERMRKLDYRPNRSTFASVISAYGLAKRVDEGKQVFASMADEFQVSPCLDHYVAMVNLYGRSGKIDEAFDFISGMAIIEPDVSIMYALLIACLRFERVKLAVRVSEKLLELEPDNGFVRKLVLRLYDLRGVSKDNLKIKRPGVKTSEFVECSWIEDKNVVHTFVSGNRGKYMNSWIENVELNMKGSVYDDVFRVLDEESGDIHSEKLALGFALVKLREFRTVRIVKNVRMCEQCHKFAKMVSKMHTCEIYVSDSKCLHRFENGVCSCGDYW